MLFGPVLMMSVLASDGGNSKLYGTVVKFLQVKFDMRCMFDLYFALKVRKRNKKNDRRRSVVGRFFCSVYGLSERNKGQTCNADI